MLHDAPLQRAGLTAFLDRWEEARISFPSPSFRPTPPLWTPLSCATWFVFRATDLNLAFKPITYPFKLVLPPYTPYITRSCSSCQLPPLRLPTSSTSAEKSVAPLNKYMATSDSLHGSKVIEECHVSTGRNACVVVILPKYLSRS